MSPLTLIRISEWFLIYSVPFDLLFDYRLGDNIHVNSESHLRPVNRVLYIII